MKISEGTGSFTGRGLACGFTSTLGSRSCMSFPHVSIVPYLISNRFCPVVSCTSLPPIVRAETRDSTSLISDHISIAASKPLALTMVLGKILKWTAFGSGAGITSFFWATRQSKVFQLPRTDYLFNTTWYARYNAENNPVLSDVCVRRVPLDQIQPDLLEKPGKLVERYCAGVWGGIGM